MPMSFAALISGMLTLVSTAPNLVVNAELVRQGDKGFGFFTVTRSFGGWAGADLHEVRREMASVRADSETPSWRGRIFTTGSSATAWQGVKHGCVPACSPLVGKPLSELQSAFRHPGACGGTWWSAVARCCNRFKVSSLRRATCCCWTSSTGRSSSAANFSPRETSS